MLNKSICQICYAYYEKSWNEETEDIWKEGFVDCPVELFEKVRYKDKEIQLDKPWRNFFGTIFGTTKANEIPNHCPYKKKHQC